MRVTVTRCVVTFISITVLLILFSTQKLSHLSSYFKSLISQKASSSDEPTFPCFTVGYAVPKSSGLGNHLFYYAGVKYVAWLTGRKPFLLTSKRKILDKAFELDIARQDPNKECIVAHFNHKYIYGYDDRVKHLKRVAGNVSIRLEGYFFSWKYVTPIEDLLRGELRFRRNLTDFAEKFLLSSVPRGWETAVFVRVGVHVRRGDFLHRRWVGIGLTVADKLYLNRAMTFFIERYSRVQFVVASDDIGWCQKNIRLSSFNQQRVNITFSIGHSAEQDLALLASCDHMIMSTGTYGWWASWLANGTTVYYKNFVRPGSNIWRKSRAADLFPPSWIGMN